MRNGLRQRRRAGVLAAGPGLLALAAIGLLAAPARAQDGAASPAPPTTITIKCSSKPGERQHCAADTSHGVALAKSAGQSPCLLGRTWGYDAQGVWVSDGCAGEFVVGQGINEATERPQAKENPPAYIPNMGFLIVEGQKGEMYVRLFSYVRYLNQKGLDSSYTDFVRPHHRREAEGGRPAQQVLPGPPRLVPDPEVPLLPLCLEREHLAGRSRPGGGRRVLELHVQPVRDPGWRHQRPSHRAQHRRPVPLLARDRQPADRGRVLPGLVHLGLLAQGRAVRQGQVHGHDREQPEPARRQRGSARQHLQHDVLHARVAAHDRRVRPLRDVRRLRLPREGGHAAGGALHPQPGGQADPAGHQQHREQPDPAHGREHRLHARPLRPGNQPSRRWTTTW